MYIYIYFFLFIYTCINPHIHVYTRRLPKCILTIDEVAAMIRALHAYLVREMLQSRCRICALVGGGI